MTNPLTKTEAALLYGYGYRLVDPQNRIWLVQGALKDSLSIIQVSPREGYMPELIDASRVGTDYHVLVHPLSRLTTEIEGIGVGILELAKISGLPNQDAILDKVHGSRMWVEVEGVRQTRYEFYLSNMNFGGYRDDKIIAISNQQALFAQMYAWHFDTMNFIERGIGKEITI